VPLFSVALIAVYEPDSANESIPLVTFVEMVLLLPNEAADPDGIPWTRARGAVSLTSKRPAAASIKSLCSLSVLFFFFLGPGFSLGMRGDGTAKDTDTDWPTGYCCSHAKGLAGEGMPEGDAPVKTATPVGEIDFMLV
jgi:hypothetical protein